MTNTSNTFDLREQPWLLARTLDGDIQELSLHDVFDRADQLHSLAGEVPSQVFALHRLLLAILIRAVPWDRSDPLDHWARAWRGEVDLGDHTRQYLSQWGDRFDLLHPKTPFLQVADLRTAKGDYSPLTSLIADVPNNHQYFTTRAGRSLEAISLAEAARWLVHAHAFDPSGIKSGAVGDTRVKGGKGYPIGTGWAGQLGGVLIEGRSLRETLLLNLVLHDTDDQLWPPQDRPAWERPSLGPTVEDGGGRVPAGLADLLTWPSRRVRLQFRDSLVVGVLIANGDPLTPQNRRRTEMMTAWRRSLPQEKKLKTSPVYMPRTHQPDRAMWRGLEALWAQVDVPTSQRAPDPGLPPGVLDWLYKLLYQEILDNNFPIRTRAIGVQYGSNNSVIDEIIDDAVLMNAVLLSEQGRVLRAAAIDAVRAADAAVLALANLAGNLAVAAGDSDGPRQRARETGFFALDAPYRRWLASLEPDTQPLDARTDWEGLVRREIQSLGDEAIAAAGVPAWIGREHRGRHIDSSLASIWFHAALRKALPLTTTDPADTPLAVSTGVTT